MTTIYNSVFLTLWPQNAMPGVMRTRREFKWGCILRAMIGCLLCLSYGVLSITLHETYAWIMRWSVNLETKIFSCLTDTNFLFSCETVSFIIMNDEYQYVKKKNNAHCASELKKRMNKMEWKDKYLKNVHVLFISF